MFMQNVQLLLTAVKCFSCVKLLLCMICILSLCYRHTHSHFALQSHYILLSLSLTLLPGSKNIQRTNAKAHYMICMHACLQMVRIFSLLHILFALLFSAHSFIRHNITIHIILLYFLLSFCCCCRFSILFSCTSSINKETESQIELKILIQ